MRKQPTAADSEESHASASEKSNEKTPAAPKSQKHPSSHGHRSGHGHRHQRINARFLTGSTAVFACVGAALFLTHAFQRDRIASTLLNRAEAAVEEHPQDAARYFHNYLDVRPHDLDARVQMSEALSTSAESPAEWMSAFRTNEIILREDPGRHEVRRRQVDVLLRLARLRDAREQLDLLLEQTPQQGDLHLLRGICYEVDRMFHQAAGDYAHAIEDRSFVSVEVNGQTWTPIEAYAARARLLREHLDEPQQADLTYAQLVRAYPKSSQAYLQRAAYRSTYGQPGAAADDARRALELEPDDVNSLLAAAELTLSDPGSTTEQRETLEAALKASLEEDQQDGRLFAMLAEYESQQGQMEAALATLQKGVAESEHSDELKLLLIPRLISQGRIEEAKASIGTLEEIEEPTMTAEADQAYLHGCVAVKEGRLVEGLQLLKSSRERADGGSRRYYLSSLLIASALSEMGRFEEALVEYRGATDIDPKSREALQGTASALAALGRRDEARKIFASLSSNDAQSSLFRARLEIEAVMRMPPSQRDWSVVTPLVDAAAASPESSSDALVLRSIILAAQGKHDQAVDMLDGLIEQQPGAVAGWVARAELALMEQQADVAHQTLTRAESQIGSHPQLDMARLKLLAVTDQKLLRDKLTALGKTSPDVDRQAWVTLQEQIAGYWHVLGEADNVLSTKRRILEHHPDSVTQWFGLLGLAIDQNEQTLVDEALAALSRIEGAEGTYALCGQAMQRLRQADINNDEAARDEATTVLREIAEQRPNWPVPHRLLGEISLRQGDRKAAVDRFVQAIHLGHTDSALLQRTTQLLVDQMRFSEALELSREALKTTPSRSRSFASLLTANLLEGQNQPEAAISIARDSVAANEKDVVSRIYLSQLLSGEGRHREAEHELRQVIAASPEHPLAWVSLVQLLNETGQTEAAMKAVEQAESPLTEFGALPALAMCYELVGRTEDAESLLRRTIDGYPQNAGLLQETASFYLRTGRKEDAETLMRQVLADPTKYENVNLISVRRVLAGAIAVKNYASFREAGELLDANIRDALSRVTDQRIKARLMLAHSHPDSQRQGLQLFDVVRRKAQLTWDENLLIAQAYDRLDETDDADRQWEALLRVAADQPRVVSGYLKRQITRDRTADLQQWVGVLTKLRPDDVSTIELSCRIDLMLADVDMALKHVLVYEQQQPVGDESPSRMQAMAALLAKVSSWHRLEASDRQRLFDEAMARYDELASDQPDQIVSQALLQGSHGRVGPALDRLESAGSSLDVMQKLAGGASVLQRAPQVTTGFDRVEAWLAEAKAAQPDSPFPMHIEEGLRRLQGQHDEAIAINQTILKHKPDHIVSLNNLAWLLSTQRQQHQQGHALLDHASQSTGPVAFLLDTRGLIRIEQGQPALAIDIFREALVQDDTPATRLHLASALLDTGDHASAVYHFRRAVAGGLTLTKLDLSDVAAFKRLNDEAGGVASVPAEQAP